MRVHLVRPPLSRVDDLVVLLRGMPPSLLTVESVQTMIRSGWVDPKLLDKLAETIIERPHLSRVTDEEWLSAVEAVAPACLPLFRSPEGLTFLHSIPRRLALRAVVGVFLWGRSDGG